MAGYSATPLVRKLGIREGFRVRLKNEPDNYRKLVAPLPDGVTLSSHLRSDVDFCHFFTREARELC
ncbi:MAG: hypothetical protein RIA65_17740, partial [Woeseia sp.]